MYYNIYNILERKIENLEMTIMSCLLQKPELMQNPRLTDDLFQNQQKLWQFMKAVYKKFGCFDLNLMYNNVRNKYNYIGMITELIDIEPVPSNIEYYIDELIRTKNEDETERHRANAIFSLAHDLIQRNITSKEFKEKVDKMFQEEK